MQLPQFCSNVNNLQQAVAAATAALAFWLPCCFPLPSLATPLCPHFFATIYPPPPLLLLRPFALHPCHLPFPLARPLWTPPLFMLHIFRCLLMTAKMRFGRREREREKGERERQEHAGNALRTFAVPLAAAAGAANFPRTYNFMQIVFVARWQSSG